MNGSYEVTVLVEFVVEVLAIDEHDATSTAEDEIFSALSGATVPLSTILSTEVTDAPMYGYTR